MRTHRLAARLVAVVGAATTALAGTVVLTAAPSHGAVVKTRYALGSHAYGTRVVSDMVALNMSRSAYSWIGCTKRAGLDPDNHPTAGNHLAATGSPSNPWVRLGAVTTANRTFRNKTTGAVGSHAVSKIADLTLTGPEPSEGVPGPAFRLEGMVTQSRAWAQGGRLHASTTLSSRDLELTLPPGTPVDEPLGQLLGAVDEGIGAVTEVLDGATGNAIEVPGLGRIRLGGKKIVRKKDWALARSRSLVVDLAGADGQLATADDSRIIVGQSQARIRRDVPPALMAGQGYPLELSVADELVRIGKVGVQMLPCAGTDGDVLGERLPAQDVFDGALELGVLTAQAFGDHARDGSATAWTRGKVNRIALGSGDQRVELAGIVGVARVHRKPGGRIVRSTKGTSIGSFSIGGEEQRLPADSRPVTLPGLGTIEFNLVERTRTGIRLTAVRITLAPGDAGRTVINLGNARTSFK